MSAILVGEDASPCKRPILRHLQPLPVRRSLGFEADLKALVDGKVRALLIPASSSRPITKADFDLDKLSQDKVARHDTRLVFLTKRTPSVTNYGNLIRLPASTSENNRMWEKIQTSRHASRASR